MTCRWEWLPKAVFCVAAFAAAIAPAPTIAKDKFVAVGTSTREGVYFPVARGICGLVNAGRDTHRVRCLANTTGGSIYNVQALMTGELDVAVTLAGLAYEAYKGTGEFKAFGSNPELRAISVLYTQPVSVIVKKNSEIKTLDDLSGKRINIGNLGSGKRGTAELLLKVLNLSRKDFAEIHEFNTKRMGEAFCTEKVDILIEAIGNPSSFLRRMIGECGGRFIEIPRKVADLMKKFEPYFEPGVIPGGMYAGQDKDVSTVNLNVVLISTARVSPDTIYEISKAMFDQFPKLKEIHPVLSTAAPQTMIAQGEVIPFHEGAARYYREAGLIGRPEAEPVPR